MTAILRGLVLALCLVAPVSVQAERDGDATAAAQDFLATADEYHQHAANVRAALSSLPPHARADAQRLIGVLQQLAQVKEQMADAIVAHGWDKQLERRYDQLKEQEQRLWQAVEAAK
ncbi:hypothetical protein V5T82_05140 [Magnetovibrio sp. PR-2]|uniref:hypothetical protein n=1 Tax=Magnetovibrio sp. PR-2 TaxID=3120356 RepID=UPI002FCDF87D